MKLTNQQKREKFNYRTTDGPGIHCLNCDCDIKITVTDNGIESECLLLKIKIDEHHICDLLC